MEEKIIVLDINTYQKLVKMIKSDQENINFKCATLEEMVSIRNKSQNKSSSEQNIVQRWMNDIIEISEEGFNNTDDSDAERYFDSIRAYCKSVIVSVTS